MKKPGRIPPPPSIKTKVNGQALTPPPLSGRAAKKRFLRLHLVEKNDRKMDRQTEKKLNNSF